MMKQISNLKLSKTKETIEREWVSVDAKRAQLLSGSDWTQTLDNTLTMENKNYWSDWRRKVREANRMSYKTPDEALRRLEQLHIEQPVEEHVANIRMRQKQYQLDISDLASAKSDAKKIIKAFTNEQVSELFPENTITTILRYLSMKEYLNYSANYPDLPSFGHFFPLLKLYSHEHNLTETETVTSVNTEYNEMVVLAANWEQIKIMYNNSIDNATSIQEIIDIVKTLHGY